MSVLSGFWAWVSGPHPIWRKIGWLALFGIVLYGSWKYLSVIVGVLFIVSFVIGHYMFRNSWWDGDGVKLIRFYKDRPSTLDWQYMGKDLFQEIPKIGDSRPVMETSAGEPVHVVENDIDGVLVFSSVQGMSKIDFISKTTAFDYAREVAEQALLERDRVRYLPKILGHEYAEGPMRAILKDSVGETITLTPNDPEVVKFLDDMQTRQDPYKALWSKYVVKEKKASDDRVREFVQNMEGQDMEGGDGFQVTE